MNLRAAADADADVDDGGADNAFDDTRFMWMMLIITMTRASHFSNDSLHIYIFMMISKCLNMCLCISLFFLYLRFSAH